MGNCTTNYIGIYMIINSISLTQRLEEHFTASKSRINCMVQIILGLFLCQSVNLSRIAARMQGKAKHESQYKKLQRFFPGVSVLPNCIGEINSGNNGRKSRSKPMVFARQNELEVWKNAS